MNNFTICTSQLSNTAYAVLKPDIGIQNYNTLIQKGVKKGNRFCIYLQDWKVKPDGDNFDKSLKNVKKTNWVFLDFDFKEPLIRTTFLKDYKNGIFSGSTFEIAFEDFHQELLTWKHTYLAGLSSSRKGLRVITYVEYKLDDQYIGIEDYVREIHKIIVRETLNALNFNLKFYKDVEKDYLDGASFRATQPTFSIDEGVIKKPDPILYKGNLVAAIDEKKEYIRRIDGFLGKLNNKTGAPANEEDFAMIINDKIEHYDYARLIFIRDLPIDYRMKAFDILKNNYKGDSIPLGNFQIFDSYVSKVKGNNIFTKQSNELDVHDTFGNTYNISFEYEKYINENIGELYKIINDKKKVILKAPAGGGKTTAFCEFVNMFDKNGIIVFAAPTNAILDQTYLKLSKIKGIKIFKNYEREMEKWTPFKKEGVNVILSSFSSLHKLNQYKINFIFIDEAHDIVDQSSFKNDWSILEHNNVILMSANPEPIINVFEDYYYINNQCTSFKKRDLDVVICKNDVIKSFIEVFFDHNRKQLIYLNDKKKGLYLYEYIEAFVSGMTNTLMINSEKKDSVEYRDLLNNSILNAQTVISTQIINEGVNILNTEWDDIIILDDRKINYLNIYQLSNRFRLIEGLRIKLLINGLKDNLIIRDSFDVRDEYAEAFIHYTNIVNQKGFHKILFENIHIKDIYNKDFTINRFALNDLIVKKYMSIIRSNRNLFNKYLGIYFNVRLEFINKLTMNEYTIPADRGGLVKSFIVGKFGVVDDFMKGKAVEGVDYEFLSRENIKVEALYRKVIYLNELLQEINNDFLGDYTEDALKLLNNCKFKDKVIIEHRCKAASKELCRSKNSLIDHYNIKGMIKYIDQILGNNGLIKVSDVNDLFYKGDKTLQVYMLGLDIDTVTDLSTYMKSLMDVVTVRVGEWKEDKKDKCYRKKPLKA